MNTITLDFTTGKDIEIAALFVGNLRSTGVDFEAVIECGINPGERLMIVTLK